MCVDRATATRPPGRISVAIASRRNSPQPPTHSLCNARDVKPVCKLSLPMRSNTRKTQDTSTAPIRIIVQPRPCPGLRSSLASLEGPEGTCALAHVNIYVTVMPQGSSRFTPMACRIPTACDWELTRSRPARRTLNCGWHTTTCYRALPRSSGCTMHIFVALWLHFGPTYIRRPCRRS
ncbi:hypothetical protein FIBSPDRAFT_338634 [Athelia psychrophila]|uniref:Uncharacterized protein n=1 Tax=Athelia psychrophila TaxID=1759441 RepID=A0A167WAI8_9AGAM|nr:hypothetical protein FIBSPDRAFT_338634 [Fibularhizoctonia sp. CBS 109695]